MRPAMQARERSKGKGRRVCLGAIFCLVLCRASCFASVGLEDLRLNLSYSSKSIDRGKQLARQGIEQNLPPKQTFAFASLSILL